MDEKPIDGGHFINSSLTVIFAHGMTHFSKSSFADLKVASTGAGEGSESTTSRSSQASARGGSGDH